MILPQHRVAARNKQPQGSGHRKEGHQVAELFLLVSPENQEEWNRTDLKSIEQPWKTHNVD